MPTPQTPNEHSSANQNPEQRDQQQRQGSQPRPSDVVASDAADAGKEAVRANAEILRSHMETAQRATRTGLEATAQRFEQASRTFSDTFGLSGPQSEEAAKRSSRDLKAMSEAGAVLAKGAQEASTRWLELAQQNSSKNFEGFNRLAACRSMTELVSLQSQFMRESFERALQTTHEVAQLSIQRMEEARRPFAEQQSGQ